MNRRTALKVVGVGLAGMAGCTSGEREENADGTSTATTAPGSTAEGTTSTERTTEEATTGETAAAPQEIDVMVGTVVEGEKLSMVVRDVRKTEKLGRFQEAAAGNTFVVVRLAVKNTTSSEFLSFSGFLQTRLKDGRGYNYSQSVAVTGQTFQGGQLAPGEVSRGDVVFEVPKDSGGLTLQFDFQAVSFLEFDRVVVDLGTRASSVADLDQNLAVEIHRPGETITRQSVGVTVNGATFTEQTGQFSSADEGYEFVVVDVTIENGTSEQQTFSTLLQMLVKDGRGWGYQLSIEGTLGLDRAYDEGTPLAPGEKRRGKLAYQVEKGVSPLYWTFEYTLWVDGDKTFWRLR